MKTTPNQRGSVILLTLIFSAVALLIIVSQTRTVVQQYEATVDYGIGQCAFHLSESGLERAMHAITENQLGGSGWDSQGSKYWKNTFSEPIYKGYTATTDVTVDQGNDDIYTLTALTSIDVNGRTVQSAVEVKVKAVRTDAEKEASVGSGLFDYGMIAKDRIKLNHNNPGMKVASYNSDNDYGVPYFGVNTGFDITIATPSSSYGAIGINNATIHGMIRTGGGRVSYSDAHRHNPSQNATVIGPDSPNRYGVDSNRISRDFDGEVTDPDLPESDGRTIQSYDQNYWQNNSSINLGSWNEETWINTERINTNQNSTITVVGDVVIDAQRNLNLGANVEIEPGAKLIIMAGENIHINANQIDQQYPAQLQIIAKSNRDVVLNNFDVFSGIINAPNSNVRLAGVGGTPKSQFRGAIVARYIESTNGVEFYYDTRLGSDNSGGEDDSDAHSGIAELTLLSWREVPPSSLP